MSQRVAALSRTENGVAAHSRASLVSLSLALALALASCNGARNEGATASLLHFSMSGDPKGFDPLHSEEQNGELVRYITGGVLVRVNRATDAVEPALAESWKVEDGSRAVTFHLRPGLKFSDGSALTARDVERTLQRALDTKEASPAGDTLRSAQGSPAIQVTSDLDVTVRYPVPKADIERPFDQLAIAPPPSSKTKFPATAGPYFVEDYKPAAYVRLARNAHFSPKPGMETVQIDIQPNREIELSRFLKGELHLINNMEPDAFRRLKAAQPAAAHDLGPSLGSDFLWFNQAPSKALPAWKLQWFRSAEFRHAISSSIQRDDIARIVYQGYAHSLAGPFSPANRFWFNTALQPRAYDPTGALKNLQAAGFQMRDGILFDKAGHAVEFSLITNAGNKARERTLAVIQDDMKKIGIRVNVAPLDFGSLVDRITKTSDYEACLLGFDNVAIDPVEQNNVWLSSGLQHAWWPQQKTPATAWEAEIDKLTLAQTATADRNVRKKAFDRVQQIFYDEEPIIYLISRDALVALSPILQGVRPVPVAPQILWNIDQFSLSPGNNPGPK